MRYLLGIVLLVSGFNIWFWAWYAIFNVPTPQSPLFIQVCLPIFLESPIIGHCSLSFIIQLLLIDIIWAMCIVIGWYLVKTRKKKRPKNRIEKEIDELKNNIQKLENKSKYENESNFCENCGNTLKPITKFCGGCGNQV